MDPGMAGPDQKNYGQKIRTDGPAISEWINLRTIWTSFYHCRIEKNLLHPIFFYFFIWAAFNTFGLVSIADCNRSFICDVFAPKCAYCFSGFQLGINQSEPVKNDQWRKVLSERECSIEDKPWRALIRAFLVHQMHSAQDHQKFVFGYHLLRKLCLLGFKPGLHELTLHK